MQGVLLLDLALYKSETFLPTPRSLHEFIVSFLLGYAGWFDKKKPQYELVRSSSVLKKQASLLKSLALPQSTSRISLVTERPTEILTHILKTTEFYEEKVEAAGTRTAKDAMCIVAREIEKDGLHRTKDLREIEEPP